MIGPIGPDPGQLSYAAIAPAIAVAQNSRNDQQLRKQIAIFVARKSDWNCYMATVSCDQVLIDCDFFSLAPFQK